MGSVDNELLGLLVKGGGGLHVHGIVTVPQLSQADGRDVGETERRISEVMLQPLGEVVMYPSYNQ